MNKTQQAIKQSEQLLNEMQTAVKTGDKWPPEYTSDQIERIQSTVDKGLNKLRSDTSSLLAQLTKNSTSAIYADEFNSQLKELVNQFHNSVSQVVTKEFQKAATYGR